MSTHGGARNLLSMARPDVSVRIIEQPMEKSQRFRYKSEGDTAGSIQGVNSTPENRTYPTIEILNYSGPYAVVKVSCVTSTTPHRPHPHSLVGPTCKLGICIVEVQSCNVISFPNIGIQQCKVPEFEEKLNQRRALRVNPFGTDETSAVTYDPKTVCLCFEVYVVFGESLVRLTPVVSNPIVDKKVCNDLVICRLSKSCSCVAGGEEIFLLCNCTIGANEEVKVCFSQLRPDGSTWTALGDFTPQDIHKRFAIVFKTPAYFDQTIQTPVEVMLQLQSAQKYGEPLPFMYIPVNRDPYGILGKRKHKDFSRIRIPDNLPTQAPKLFDFGATSYMPSSLRAPSGRFNDIVSFPRMPVFTSGEQFGHGLAHLDLSQLSFKTSLHGSFNISNDPRFNNSAPSAPNIDRAPISVFRASTNVVQSPMNMSRVPTNVSQHSMNLAQHLLNDSRTLVRNTVPSSFNPDSNVVASTSASRANLAFPTIKSSDIHDDNLFAGGVQQNIPCFRSSNRPVKDEMRPESRPSEEMSSFQIPRTVSHNYRLMTSSSSTNLAMSGCTSSIRPSLSNTTTLSGVMPHSLTQTFCNVTPSTGQPAYQMGASQIKATSDVTHSKNRTTVISQIIPPTNPAIYNQPTASSAVANVVQTTLINSPVSNNADYETISENSPNNVDYASFSDEALMNMILSWRPQEGLGSAQIIPSINSAMTNVPTALLSQHIQELNGIQNNSMHILRPRVNEQFLNSHEASYVETSSNSYLLNSGDVGQWWNSFAKEVIVPQNSPLNIPSPSFLQQVIDGPYIESLGESEEYIQLPIDTVHNAAMNSTQNAAELTDSQLPDVLQSWLDDVPEYQLRNN